MHQARTLASPLIRQMFERFICAETKHKGIPQDVIAMLDPIALAVWYMDDGSLAHNEGQEDRASLHTTGFTRAEHETLAAALMKFNIACYIQTDGRGYNTLQMDSASSERLFLLVAPYVPPVMQRKLPERYRGGPGWTPGDASGFQKALVPLTISSVGPWVAPDHGVSEEKFDLTTETHNFFANGILVHNSSTTYFVDPGAEPDQVNGACTRNVNLLQSDSTIWTGARRLDIHALLADTFPGRRAFVQGETFGAGVKKNPLRLPDTRFAAYNLTVDGTDVPRAGWPAWLLAIAVPVRDDLTYPTSTDQALADVEKLPSKLNPARHAEGVVWRASTGGFVQLPDGQMVRASWKCFSNHYLTKFDL